MIAHVHDWTGWAASFVRLGFLGNTRTCRGCGVIERRHLAGYDSPRKNRIVARLNASLVRNGRQFA